MGNDAQGRYPTVKVLETDGNQSTWFTKPTRNNSGHKVLLYGVGGVGKTTLAAQLQGMSVIFDFEGSLSKLKTIDDVIDSGRLLVAQAASYSDFYAKLKDFKAFDGIDNIIIDTMSEVEDMLIQYILSSVPLDKGGVAKTIDDYAYGKGQNYIYESFLPLLRVLDAHCNAGRNIVIVAHAGSQTKPNPQGIDFIVWEPRLQAPKSGNHRCIRAKMIEWCDHVLFLTQIRNVSNDGKASSCVQRILYTSDQGWVVAKSRSTSEVLVVGDNVWDCIIPTKVTHNVDNNKEVV